eukprot:366033-Chlamydomonas_euryale.AAC.1
MPLSSSPVPAFQLPLRFPCLSPSPAYRLHSPNPVCSSPSPPFVRAPLSTPHLYASSLCTTVCPGRQKQHINATTATTTTTTRTTMNHATQCNSPTTAPVEEARKVHLVVGARDCAAAAVVVELDVCKDGVRLGKPEEKNAQATG